MSNEMCQFVSSNVVLGIDVVLSKMINLYGCQIGDQSRIGAFVEIQKNAKIGKKCKISSHSFVCEGVEIGDECFIGHGVMFTNDLFPRAVNEDGELEKEADWMGRFVPTIIEDRVSIGSNATIIGGVRLGTGSLIGAGSVVTKDVPAGEIWAGNPARFLKKIDSCSGQGSLFE